MTDTAEYWNDIKDSFNRPKHTFTHAKGFDCGHFHVYESDNINEVDCYACKDKLPEDFKKLMADKTANKEKQRLNHIQQKSIKKKPNHPVCECGFGMIKRSNSNGKNFFGCSQYPKCKCTKSV